MTQNTLTCTNKLQKQSAHEEKRCLEQVNCKTNHQSLKTMRGSLESAVFFTLYTYETLIWLPLVIFFLQVTQTQNFFVSLPCICTNALHVKINPFGRLVSSSLLSLYKYEYSLAASCSVFGYTRICIEKMLVIRRRAIGIFF